MPKIVNRDEVRAAIEDGRAVVLEALPAEYFDEGHLPGAQNLPHDEVDELAAQLIPDKSTPVVVYCANGTCANSGFAAKRLEELGYENVSDYNLGKQDWIDAGLPTEQASHPVR